MLKLNVDASFVVAGWVGLGVVGRNSEGHVSFVATRRVKSFWSPEVAEAKALLMAVRLDKCFDFDEVILESDCQVIIKRLS